MSVLFSYIVNIPNASRIIIVLGCEVMQELGDREKLGNPESLEPKEGSTGTIMTPKHEEDVKQPGAISSNGFYGNGNVNRPNNQAQKQSQLPTRTQGGGGNTSGGNIYPIESLSPYAHKWTIKARCTSKGDIKTWHNKNGEGKLFSVNLLDESGEIRATGFNAECDALYDLFKEGNVYYISAPARIQIAKKQFSNVNNDYEMNFERDTVVEKAEDQDNVPQVRYNFTNLAALQETEKDSTIDVIGILQEVGETSQITSKTTSKPYDKRELTLVDNTGFNVRLTIWGNTATSFDAQPQQVIAFKGVKVSDFGGRSLSLLSSGSMTLDPDIDDAHKLKGWYDAQGQNETYKSHASVMGMTSGRKDEYKTVAAVRDEQLGMSDEKPDYFSLKATVIYVKSESIAYPACQTDGCNKKVIETDPGNWRCEKCDKSWEKPLYRYILQVNASDFTGQLWLSCFDDTGRVIMGCPADDLMALKENDEKAFTEKVADANCRTYNFRIRAKLDNFQEQQRCVLSVSMSICGHLSDYFSAEFDTMSWEQAASTSPASVHDSQS